MGIPGFRRGWQSFEDFRKKASTVRHPFRPLMHRDSSTIEAFGDQPLPQRQIYAAFVVNVGIDLSKRLTVYVDPSLPQPLVENAQECVSLVGTSDRGEKRQPGLIGGAIGGDVCTLATNEGSEHESSGYETGAAGKASASLNDSARALPTPEAYDSECLISASECGVERKESLPGWSEAVVGSHAPPRSVHGPDPGPGSMFVAVAIAENRADGIE